MPNEIPSAIRKKVIERDNDRCFRCGMKGTEIQHRKRRREGGHGLSNLIRICRTCHAWIHAHPQEAMETGYTVSVWRNVTEAPIERWDGAWLYLTDDGGLTFAVSD